MGSQAFSHAAPYLLNLLILYIEQVFVFLSLALRPIFFGRLLCDHFYILMLVYRL